MQLTPAGIPVASDSAPALPPAARRARAQRRLAELWEKCKLPPAEDPIYEEIERELGLTEKRVRELHAAARGVTKGLSGLYIRTPTGSGRGR